MIESHGKGEETDTEGKAAPPAALPSGQRARGLFSRLFVLGLNAFLVWALLCAVANLVPLDYGFFEFVLIYPPAVAFAVLCGLLTVFFVRRRQPRRAFASAAAALGLLASLGWGTTERVSNAPQLVLLSLNCHNETDGAALLAKLCAEQHADLVFLQELRTDHWAPFVDALADYQFFSGDRSKIQADVGQISCLTGIRRDVLGTPPEVRVETGITSFRTFATRAAVGGHVMWLVNVHAQRPFYPSKHFRGLLGGGADHAFHRRERDQLNAWLVRHEDETVLVAGDFNAPRRSSNVKLPGMTLAYDAAGSGPHLTFPAYLPMVGIDQTLGNRFVEFITYTTFNAGFSDHKAQLVHFTLRTEGAVPR
jgi:endonuclease/exonuclease/phosphatase (EEP) superfamily protein YafD